MNTSAPTLNQKSLLPPLTPLRLPWMDEVLNEKQLLDELFEKYSSPLNVHYTPAFVDNYKSYKAVFDKYNIPHLIFFARKANKCKAFVKTAKENGFGVDTASYNELKQCLEIGLAPEKLVFTAAVKTEKALSLAIEENVLIILDNDDEAALTQSIAKKMGKKAIIGMRISGFTFRNQKSYSRFGFNLETLASYMAENFNKTASYSNLDYKGLHFHLNGYSIEERSIALSSSLKVAKQLKNRGFNTEFIDIGGGFLMNYLSSTSEWENFNKHLQAAVRGEKEAITFQNNGLGYEMIEGKLQGQMKVYPYFNEIHKSAFLEKILLYEDEEANSLLEEVQEAGIEIRMEPGRSMLDQTGFTMARVAFRKKDLNGDWLVGLEMNMTQMYSSSADYLLDPVVIYNDNDKQEEQAVEVYFTGAYCLERDIILKRKIALPKLPKRGDVVAFLNTAGYMMHFFESEAHLFDLANNLVLTEEKNNYQAEDFKID